MQLSYLVTIIEVEEDKKTWSVLLSKSQLADFLVHIDDQKYEIGDIMSTFSEKSDNTLQFCKVDPNLELGNKGDNNDQ